MSTFYFTVSCPFTLKSDRLPVAEVEIDGKLHHIVNTCETPREIPPCASGASPPPCSGSKAVNSLDAPYRFPQRLGVLVQYQVPRALPLCQRLAEVLPHRHRHPLVVVQ